MEILKKSIISTFKEKGEVYSFSGTFQVEEGATTLSDFKADIYGESDAYKGNVYLREEALKYNFSNVDAEEATAIIAACEACVAEATKTINA